MSRIRSALGRPLPWRIAAGIAAGALLGLALMAGPGSVQVLAQAPVTGRDGTGMPRWAQPCVAAPIVSAKELFCARIDGRVIASTTKGDGETHLIVVGGFHVTLVELERGIRVPPWGARIVAVGPLVGAGYGLREVRAVSLTRR